MSAGKPLIAMGEFARRPLMVLRDKAAETLHEAEKRQHWACLAMMWLSRTAADHT